MKIGGNVIDKNGYTGIVKNIWETGQVQVLQKPNVTCTYDSEKQLKPYNPCEGYIPVIQAYKSAF